MKINPWFLLKKIDDAYFVLPFGQGISDHKRGIRLNETGLFLWESLAKAPDEEALLNLLAEYVEAEPGDMEVLAEDVHLFLDSLYAEGILAARRTDYLSGPCCKQLSIAGLTLRLEGNPDFFSENLSLFENHSFDISEPELTVTAITGTPYFNKLGSLVLRNEQLSVIDCEEYYDLLFHINRHVSEAHIDKSGKKAVFYCQLPCDANLREELFHAVRLAFLYRAAMQGYVAIHSASILYRGKAWLFSGHSGIGKSTHTDLWAQLYDISRINGDLNLLALEGDEPVIHGIPWCGTSGICDTKTYPLGGIILLNRSKENHTSELSLAEKALLINQRLISPAWTEEMFNTNWAVTEKIASKVLICKLHCTKEPEAATVMKARIDRYLDTGI